MARFYAAEDTEALQPALSKCRVKYAAAWPRLQKQAAGTGSTCDAPRFVPVAAATVVDDLTGLEWLMKFEDPPFHDPDLVHTHEGAFVDFLESSSGSSGSADWRIPTRAELQTILAEPHPCTSSPCIDEVFGPTAATFYWTSTRDARPGFVGAWGIDFGTGLVGNAALTEARAVRAVWGGL